MLQKDEIVDIKASQVRYFGTTGKMLLPSQTTVAALLERIPRGKLITTDLLRKSLAEQFSVQGTCPVTTKKALQAISQVENQSIPYWRVIKQNGELMAYYPGGFAGHAERLLAEKFLIDATKKVPRVQNFKAHIVDWTQVYPQI